MTPLIITAVMASSPCLSAPIHLDGLLLAALHRSLGDAVLEKPCPALGYRDGIPRSSASFVVSAGPFDVVETSETSIKGLKISSHDKDVLRLPPTVIPNRPRNLKITKDGPMRTTLNRKPILHGVGRLVWHAFGDADAIETILDDVAHVGAMTNAGYGEVTRWTVEDSPFDEATTGWFHRGRIVRRLPAAMLPFDAADSRADGCLAVDACPTSPYWSEAGKVPCMDPSLVSMMRRADELRSLRRA